MLRLRDIDFTELQTLLTRIGLNLVLCDQKKAIPASFWGDAEAGLQGHNLYARNDTPLHSILHESCHYICVDANRRQRLDTDAGSDDAEEAAVCYLQILLADAIDACGRERMFSDMDAWGYSFRAGSSKAWFDDDADDALAWLLSFDLIDNQQRPKYRLRHRR